MERYEPAVEKASSLYLRVEIPRNAYRLEAYSTLFS